MQLVERPSFDEAFLVLLKPCDIVILSRSEQSEDDEGQLLPFSAQSKDKSAYYLNIKIFLIFELCPFNIFTEDLFTS
jgi:hypothetical protein